VGVISWAGESRDALRRFELTQSHMGTRFRIVLYADSEAVANRAATAAMQRIAAIDASLSDYKADSELRRISAASPMTDPMAVSDDLWNVLSHAQRLSAVSGGAFDVTVGPYSRLWRRARRRKELPTAELLATARERVGHRHVRLDSCGQSVQLLAPGMQLDLGAIAKGYAADEALAALRSHGIDAALVDASGDIVASDPPPNKAAWNIQVAGLGESRADEGSLKAGGRMQIANRAIATSGDLYQHVEMDGRRYSHIIDPRTGIGIPGQTSVTVIAPNGMMADSLASAISVLGVEEGLRLAAETPNVACRFEWIEEGGTRHRRDTANFQQYVNEQ